MRKQRRLHLCRSKNSFARLWRIWRDPFTSNEWCHALFLPMCVWLWYIFIIVVKRLFSDALPWVLFIFHVRSPPHTPFAVPTRERSRWIDHPKVRVCLNVGRHSALDAAFRVRFKQAAANELAWRKSKSLPWNDTLTSRRCWWMSHFLDYDSMRTDETSWQLHWACKS